MPQKTHTMHGRDHCPGGSDPIPCMVAGPPVPSTFYDAVLALAETSDLRGYWRLGDGGFGPYADSKPVSSPWANAPMERSNETIDLTDLATGGLAAAQDDGAVGFNSSAGTDGDYLTAPATWSTGPTNPFQAQLGVPGGSDGLTVAAWVKPSASASSFDAGVFSMLSTTAGPTLNGYVLGIQWPTRTLFFQAVSTRLDGSVLVADEWVFAVAVYDATSTRIYLDGALVATGASVNPEPATNLVPSIGRYSPSVAGGRLYAAVDEVSVWGAPLTPAEIATLWDAGTGAAGDEGGEGTVPVSDGAGGTSWVYPTKVDGIRYAEILPGDNVTATDNGDGTVTLASIDTFGATAADTLAWMPLTTVTGGVPELVWDGSDDLIPTLVAM